MSRFLSGEGGNGDGRAGSAVGFWVVSANGVYVVSVLLGPVFCCSRELEERNGFEA